VAGRQLEIKTKKRSSLHLLESESRSRRSSEGRLLGMESDNPRASSALEKRELRWRDDTADIHSSFLDSADKGIAKSGMQQSCLTASNARSSGISRGNESQQAVKAGAAALQSKAENPFDIPLLTKRRAAPLETATPTDVPRASNTERDASDGLRRFPDTSILAPTMSDRREAPRVEHTNNAASIMIEDHSNVDSLNRSLSYPQSDAVMFGKFTREEYLSDSARTARDQTPTFNKQRRSTSNVIIAD
jgi:hypothetical protein